VVISRIKSLRSWGLRLALLPLSLKRHLLSYGTVAVVATGVMIPRMLAPNFGLLDDGVTIYVSSYILQEFKAGNWGVLFGMESDRGRFKPLVLLYYTIPYAVSGLSPLGYFVMQWLGLVLTGIIIFKLVEAATSNLPSSILSSVFYLLSPPIFENYYTLSKGEPPMVLWLALSLLFLNQSTNIQAYDKKLSYRLFLTSMLFLSLAYFTKETVHAMVLISGLWTISAWWQSQYSKRYEMLKNRYKYFFVNLLIVSIYWGVRYFSGTVEVASGEDSGKYQLVLGNMYASTLKYMSWYIRDFSYLVPILLFALYPDCVSQRRKIFSGNMCLLDSLLWIVGWAVIMLPWHSSLEYYLLPATLGVSIIAGIGVSTIARHLCNPLRGIRIFVRVALFCILLMNSICLMNGFTNGRVQISVDSVNSELLDYLALNIPPGGTLLVNLPEPNEYVVEIGLHLALLKQRQDVRVRYFKSLHLPTDAGAFIVTPIMENQPYPSVRIAVHEEGARAWKAELHAQLRDNAKLMDQKVEKVRLFMVAVETTICPWLIRANVLDGVYCGVKRPAIDTRLFHYGWEVYRI
jgi:hypothetical protein